MINKQEILTIARELKLSPYTVEKDYVLSWVLAGIAAYTSLNESLIFKGGTCLKKCFFKNYRFSEDLDFSINKQNKFKINEYFLQDSFSEISRWIYDSIGIEIPEKNLSFQLNKNEINPTITGSLNYRGPLQRQRGSLSRIKLDITLNEKLVSFPEKRSIYHHYSDSFDKNTLINTYCIEEIFAEKLRALADRMRPRDLYDVVSLYASKHLWHPDSNKTLSILKIKCDHKNIPLPTMEFLNTKTEKAELIAEWRNMLDHQISFLKPLESYWQMLPEILDWLYTKI